MATGELMDRLLVAGLDDWLHLADVAWAVRDDRPELAEADLIRAGIDVIRGLLEGGLAEVGDVTDGGFLAWDLHADEATSRVERRWTQLGRDPVPGDICWVANTRRGDQAALALLGRDPS